MLGMVAGPVRVGVSDDGAVMLSQGEHRLEHLGEERLAGRLGQGQVEVRARVLHVRLQRVAQGRLEPGEGGAVPPLSGDGRDLWLNDEPCLRELQR